MISILAENKLVISKAHESRKQRYQPSRHDFARCLQQCNISIFTYLPMMFGRLTKNRRVITTSSKADVPRAMRLSFCTPYAIAAPDPTPYVACELRCGDRLKEQLTATKEGTEPALAKPITPPRATIPA